MDSAPRHPFGYRDYRLYFAGRVMATIGQLCMVVVIGWQAYDIARRTMSVHDAALQLGWIGVAQFTPLLVLTLLTGWLADVTGSLFSGLAASVVLLFVGSGIAFAQRPSPVASAEATMPTAK